MKKKHYRHGDVVLIPVDEVKGEKLGHLTLALGEVTGHSHRIEGGNAALFAFENEKYLEIQDELATLVHEQHKALELPRGNYQIIIQREYDDKDEWRQVMD